jgi:hypothetical protein
MFSNYADIISALTLRCMPINTQPTLELKLTWLTPIDTIGAAAAVNKRQGPSSHLQTLFQRLPHQDSVRIGRYRMPRPAVMSTSQLHILVSHFNILPYMRNGIVL